MGEIRGGEGGRVGHGGLWENLLTQPSSANDTGEQGTGKGRGSEGVQPMCRGR